MVKKIYFFNPFWGDRQAPRWSLLDRETARIDEEVSLLNGKKSLLLEYRKALIFEAVTGKINLKNILNNTIKTLQQ